MKQSVRGGGWGRELGSRLGGWIVGVQTASGGRKVPVKNGTKTVEYLNFFAKHSTFIFDR